MSFWKKLKNLLKKDNSSNNEEESEEVNEDNEIKDYQCAIERLFLTQNILLQGLNEYTSGLEICLMNSKDKGKIVWELFSKLQTSNSISDNEKVRLTAIADQIEAADREVCEHRVRGAQCLRNFVEELTNESRKY